MIVFEKEVDQFAGDLKQLVTQYLQAKQLHTIQKTLVDWSNLEQQHKIQGMA